MRVLAVVWVAALVGCHGERPSTFSAGTTWTFPLVDPLAGDELLVPVYIDHRGPFLFALDPGARSRVDRAALVALRRVTELWLHDVQIGDLTVRDSG